MRFLLFAASCLMTSFAAPPRWAAQQAAFSLADRLINDPRVPSLTPYGLNLPPQLDPTRMFSSARRSESRSPVIPISGELASSRRRSSR
jgi:hypothetical protein